jgi:hypothetical protein
MKHRLILLPLLLTAQALTAQPIDIPFDIPLCMPGSVTSDFYSCGPPSVAALANGRFVVLSPVATVGQRSLVAEIVDVRGRVGGRTLAHVEDLDRWLSWPAVAADGSGGFVVAWNFLRPPQAEIHLQWFDAAARPRRAPVVVAGAGESLCNWLPVVAANAAGDAVVAWEQTPECANVGPTPGLEVQAFNARGNPTSARLHIDPAEPIHGLGSPRVGIDAAGRFTVLWVEGPGSPSPYLKGQRFHRNGQPLGEPFEIRDEGCYVQDSLVLQDGRVAVVWDTSRSSSLHALGLYERDGTPAAPRLDLGDGPAGRIAADRHGNLALFGAGTNGLRILLVSRDLVPQIGSSSLPAVDVPTDIELTLGGGLALSDLGLVLMAGTKSVNFDDRYLLAHFVWARHESDPCGLTADGALVCNTAGDGSTATPLLRIDAAPPWGTPFLADWDGDGRDDLCVARTRIFSCDLSHDGHFDVATPRIGKAGDVPLLADLDGDGKADPCVHRGAALLCDRARDGGAMDLRIAFGDPGERLILGDPDGDGRDDPCVNRQGVLLCDTGHDGGEAELRLDLTSLQARGLRLLGDVNGDGRDDVCMDQGSRFLCAVFSAEGGQPVGTWEIGFGPRGVIPLLGDVDAF